MTLRAKPAPRLNLLVRLQGRQQEWIQNTLKLDGGLHGAGRIGLSSCGALSVFYYIENIGGTYIATLRRSHNMSAFYVAGGGGAAQHQLQRRRHRVADSEGRVQAQTDREDKERNDIL